MRLVIHSPSNRLMKGPVGTLRDWEQGRSEPDQPARAYLLVIARAPEKVAELLHD